MMTPGGTAPKVDTGLLKEVEEATTFGAGNYGSSGEKYGKIIGSTVDECPG